MTIKPTARPERRRLCRRETRIALRYHDVNADIGGYIVPDRLWWYSSVRDQEISSRLVNFPVGAPSHAA